MLAVFAGVGSVPSAIALACTVNGYERHPEIEGLWSWGEEQLALLRTESADQFSTQNLLDVLCYINRAERFIEGTMESYAAEIDIIVRELIRRVEHRGS